MRSPGHACRGGGLLATAGAKASRRAAAQLKQRAHDRASLLQRGSVMAPAAPQNRLARFEGMPCHAMPGQGSCICPLTGLWVVVPHSLQRPLERLCCSLVLAHHILQEAASRGVLRQRRGCKSGACAESASEHAVGADSLCAVLASVRDLSPASLREGQTRLACSVPHWYSVRATCS